MSLISYLSPCPADFPVPLARTGDESCLGSPVNAAATTDGHFVWGTLQKTDLKRL